MIYDLRINKNILSLIRVFLLSIILNSLFIIPSVLAGEIKFFLGETDFLSDKFRVEAILDSEEPINALEGEIFFADDYADLEAVSDGNSIINFWIKRPKATEENHFEFAGVIPGGFKGRQGSLFTLVFKSKSRLNPGEKIANFIVGKEVRGLVNDGQGSAAKLSLAPFDLAVPFDGALLSGGQAGEVKPNDYYPPENFTPEIGRDPLVFAGKYFLVFGTQDKDSGVSYYEVKEGGRSFLRAESPYLLENQLLTERIFIRAVDYAGNVQITATYPNGKTLTQTIMGESNASAYAKEFGEAKGVTLAKPINGMHVTRSADGAGYYAINNPDSINWAPTTAVAQQMCANGVEGCQSSAL